MSETFPEFAQYDLAIGCIAVASLIALVQSFLTAPLAFTGKVPEQEPGMPLRGDYSSLSFRALRTYSNTVESLPAFGFSVLVAVIAHANVAAVNWLAMAYIGFRVLFWIFYYSGRGKHAGGPRTMAYVGCLLSNIAIACLAIHAVIF